MYFKKELPGISNFSSESLLNGKAKDRFAQTSLIGFLIRKTLLTSVPSEEVNRTEPSPSIGIPWLEIFLLMDERFENLL